MLSMDAFCTSVTWEQTMGILNNSVLAWMSLEKGRRSTSNRRVQAHALIFVEGRIRENGGWIEIDYLQTVCQPVCIKMTLFSIKALGQLSCTVPGSFGDPVPTWPQKVLSVWPTLRTRKTEALTSDCIQQRPFWSVIHELMMMHWFKQTAAEQPYSCKKNWWLSAIVTKTGISEKMGINSIHIVLI